MGEITHTENVVVRMTPKEKTDLAKKAREKGVSMSQLIRDSIISPPDVTRDEYEKIKDMITYEIRKLGVNVNQIARKYNEYSYVEPSVELMNKLNQIIDLMYEITVKVSE